jgi:hypothetical protein
MAPEHLLPFQSVITPPPPLSIVCTDSDSSPLRALCGVRQGTSCLSKYLPPHDELPRLPSKSHSVSQRELS